MALHREASMLAATLAQMSLFLAAVEKLEGCTICGDWT